VQIQSSRREEPEQIKGNHQPIRKSDYQPIAWAERQPKKVEMFSTEPFLCDDRCNHNQLLIELAVLRADNERLQKVILAELANTAGARIEGEFLRSHSKCRRSWCDDERHTWPPKRWIEEAGKQEDSAHEYEPRKDPGRE
jgi:hypothetical protein